MIALSVKWHRIGYPGVWFSRYERGEISSGNLDGIAIDLPSIFKIYRHKQTGQIRIYSGRDMNGSQVTVNGARPVTLRPRGRHGKLYLGFRED